MKVSVLVFPGTNREKDVCDAFEAAGHLRPDKVWHHDEALPIGTDLVILPGGFSFGDYLRSGAIAAHSPIMKAVKTHAEKGGYVLGICNGFQMLCETRLLPGVLMHNKTRRFICKKVHLKVGTTNSLFTQNFKPDQLITAPIAHGEGNFFSDEETLKRLEHDDLIAFRYVDTQGHASETANPNGSQHNIAGILSANRRVLGLMPHLENHILPEQGNTDGLPMFACALTTAA